MHAPAMSGREARELLDKVLRQEKTCHARFDRDIFEAAYGHFDYKEPFERFCRTGELPLVVISHCQGKLWRNKL